MDDLYVRLTADPPAGRPHVALGMVMAADGAVVVAGGTGRLGGEADRLAFRRLRERADVILAGAETVRREGYGPPRLSRQARDRRVTRGQDPLPRIAVVTASGRLDAGARLFSGRPAPLVVTTEEADTAHLDGAATVLRAGSGRVDWSRALRRLREGGARWLLVEGGPSVNGQLAEAGLVDELYVTIAPALAGGRAGLLGDPLADAPRPLRLVELHRVDDEVLLRYRVRRHGSGAGSQ